MVWLAAGISPTLGVVLIATAIDPPTSASWGAALLLVFAVGAGYAQYAQDPTDPDLPGRAAWWARRAPLMLAGAGLVAANTVVGGAAAELFRWVLLCVFALGMLRATWNVSQFFRRRRRTRRLRPSNA